MSRVDRNSEAQRLAQARQQKEASKAKNKDAGSKFAKVKQQKQGGKQEGVKQQVLKQGTRGQANAAMMAQGGMQANKFSSMLFTQGNKNLDQSSGLDKGRETDKAEVTEEGKLSEEGLSMQEDSLSAISDENTGSGGGSGGGASDSGSEQQAPNQMTDAAGGVGELGKMEGATAAQAAHAAPRIPPQVLQELVNRVFVGLNEKGLNEFHIQLKDDVLGGAMIKITSEGGKIKAEVQTKDVNAGRLIKASEGELARAFGRKGLYLESLSVNQ